MTSADHALEATWDDVASNTVFSIPYLPFTSPLLARQMCCRGLAMRRVLANSWPQGLRVAFYESTQQPTGAKRACSGDCVRSLVQAASGTLRGAASSRSHRQAKTTSHRRHFRSPGELARGLGHALMQLCLQPMGDRFVQRASSTRCCRVHPRVIPRLAAATVAVAWGSWGARAVVMLNYSEFADGGDVVAKLATLTRQPFAACARPLQQMLIVYTIQSQIWLSSPSRALRPGAHERLCRGRV